MQLAESNGYLPEIEFAPISNALLQRLPELVDAARAPIPPFMETYGAVIGSSTRPGTRG